MVSPLTCTCGRFRPPTGLRHSLAPERVYADERGLDRLQTALALSSPARGENVVVTVPEDQGVFRDAVEPAPRGRVLRSGADLSGSISGWRASPRSCRAPATGEDGMEKVTSPEPQSASDYDDRTTAAVKSVLIEVGQILGACKGKFGSRQGAGLMTLAHSSPARMQIAAQENLASYRQLG
jgi:hypothetical protein